MKGHVNIYVTMGTGPTVYASSTQRKINTVRSTETEVTSAGEKLQTHLRFWNLQWGNQVTRQRSMFCTKRTRVLPFFYKTIMEDSSYVANDPNTFTSDTSSSLTGSSKSRSELNTVPLVTRSQTTSLNPYNVACSESSGT